MAKKSKSHSKSKRVPKLKRVKLPPTAVLEVVVPKGTAPVVLLDPDKGVVKIIPAAADKIREQTWWEWLRG